MIAMSDWRACDSWLLGAGYVEKQMTNVKPSQNGGATVDMGVELFHRIVNHVSPTVERCKAPCAAFCLLLLRLSSHLFVFRLSVLSDWSACGLPSAWFDVAGSDLLRSMACDHACGVGSYAGDPRLPPPCTVWVKKSPPEDLWQFFQNRREFFNQILHAYYPFLSTLDYKFLFNYLQLWRSYAILSVTTHFTSCAQNVHHQPKRIFWHFSQTVRNF